MSFETPNWFLTVMGHPMIELPLSSAETDEETGKTNYDYDEPVAAGAWAHDNWLMRQIIWTPVRMQVRRMMKEAVPEG